ncbi:hypothetical protein OJ253_3412 [Cryptosporidium canis]|uniref:Uncharacterized protein n=1 Tax=Cryptosporidium canis TaxID=195482 RepID=A0A9D5DF37_9CRYT|nr:hypothetical protein OJ253_3412 [Cryptosporidium canis]
MGSISRRGQLSRDWIPSPNGSGTEYRKIPGASAPANIQNIRVNRGGVEGLSLCVGKVVPGSGLFALLINDPELNVPVHPQLDEWEPLVGSRPDKNLPWVVDGPDNGSFIARDGNLAHARLQVLVKNHHAWDALSTCTAGTLLATDGLHGSWQKRNDNLADLHPLNDGRVKAKTVLHPERVCQNRPEVALGLGDLPDWLLGFWRNSKVTLNWNILLIGIPVSQNSTRITILPTIPAQLKPRDGTLCLLQVLKHLRAGPDGLERFPAGVEQLVRQLGAEDAVLRRDVGLDVGRLPTAFISGGQDDSLPGNDDVAGDRDGVWELTGELQGPRGKACVGGPNLLDEVFHGLGPVYN